MYYDPHIHDGFVEIEEAAVRMNMTPNQVADLARRHVLRAVDIGMGIVLVEPAIVSGST